MIKNLSWPLCFPTQQAWNFKPSLRKLRRSRSHIMTTYYSFVWAVTLLNLLRCMTQIAQTANQQPVLWNVLWLITRFGEPWGRIVAGCRHCCEVPACCPFSMATQRRARCILRVSGRCAYWPQRRRPGDSFVPAALGSAEALGTAWLLAFNPQRHAPFLPPHPVSQA